VVALAEDALGDRLAVLHPPRQEEVLPRHHGAHPAQRLGVDSPGIDVEDHRHAAGSGLAACADDCMESAVLLTATMDGSSGPAGSVCMGRAIEGKLNWLLRSG